MVVILPYTVKSFKTIGHGCMVWMSKILIIVHLRGKGMGNPFTVTSWCAPLRLTLPASRLFTQHFIQAQIKENIKVPRHWPLCGEFTGDRWIPAQWASNAENISIWWRHHGTLQQPQGICLQMIKVDIMKMLVNNKFSNRASHWRRCVVTQSEAMFENERNLAWSFTIYC